MCLDTNHLKLRVVSPVSAGPMHNRRVWRYGGFFLRYGFADDHYSAQQSSAGSRTLAFKVHVLFYHAARHSLSNRPADSMDERIYRCVSSPEKITNTTLLAARLFYTCHLPHNTPISRVPRLEINSQLRHSDVACFA